MQFLTTFIATALLVVSANAAIDSNTNNHLQPALRRHHQQRDALMATNDAIDAFIERGELLGQDDAPVEKRAKKCKNKKSKKHKHHKQKQQASSSEKHHKSKATHANKSKSDAKLSTSSGSSIFGKGNGLIGAKFSSSCQPDASEDHPNGVQSFLSCGLDTSKGWNPPDVKLSQIKMISADEAAKASLFAPCQQYLWAFKQAEKSTNVPAVLLMSFAMQESTCRASVVGGNGEQGLMQLTPDKCGGAPGGNCKDVGFNVNKGAEYFKSQLDANNGNALLAAGTYNGWYKGMTVKDATAAARSGNCHAQQNLDYVYQLFSGWVLAKSDNPYAMGKYQNLKNCQ